VARAVAVIVLSSLSLVACSRAPSASSSVPTIAEVIDGDTVVVRASGHTETVRLIGVDTPETKHPTKPVQCFGPEASAFTKHVLPKGTAVRLERDREARDHFGRLLAYVYRADDGLFVNVELARRGYARALTIAPNDAHAHDVAAAIAEARSEGRGLWAACQEGS
jgi:micrococcal nuclease